MGLRSTLAFYDIIRRSYGPRLDLESPWVDNSHLESITWAELYPEASAMPVTRGEAMRVPAVARARHLIVSTIARLPIRAYRAGQPLADQPVWTYHSGSPQSPAMRLAGTVDDLIFHGKSLWIGRRNTEGELIRAEHCPFDAWEDDPDNPGRFLVAGQPVAESTAILIPGLHEGICTFGQDAIRGAAATMAGAVDAATYPLRLELHDTGDYPMTDAERATFVAEARTAMRNNAGVVYTSPGVESKMHPVGGESLLVDGRESFAVDIARTIGLPSAMIDAHSRGATMTYSTNEDVITAFLNLGLTLYMTPITARLSLDDVAPRGTEIRFEADAVLGIQSLTDQPDREPTA